MGSILKNHAAHLLSVAAFLALGCGGQRDDDGSLGAGTRSNESAIIGGANSPADQDEVVLLLDYEPERNPPRRFVCTATLLAPNLIVTARHCVSEANESAEFCGDNETTGNVDPSALYVFVGPKPPGATDDPKTYEKAAARGKKIFDDGTKRVHCGHDLALVLLDKEIPNAKIAPIRLEDTTTAGELLTAVGWGVTEAGAQIPPNRKQRRGLTIEALGPLEGSVNNPPLGEPDFYVAGEAACVGDSGGPAFSVTRAVIGVVSLVGNGVGSTPPDMCQGDTAATAYAKTSAFKGIITQAYAEAGHTPWIEGTPNPGTNPPGSDGGTGGGGDAGGGGGDGGSNSATDSKSGCAVAGSTGARTSFGIFGVLVAGLLLRRRRAGKA